MFQLRNGINGVAAAGIILGLALGYSGGRGAAGSVICLHFSVLWIHADTVQNNKAAITNAKLVFSIKSVSLFAVS